MATDVEAEIINHFKTNKKKNTRKLVIHKSYTKINSIAEDVLHLGITTYIKRYLKIPKNHSMDI